MKIHLQSIDHAPKTLPAWQSMLDDLGRPPPKRVARVLGVGVRTVYRYNRDGHVPRAVLLALFWLTSWGRSAVHAQAWNDAQVAVGYVDALQREVARLQGTVDRLQALGHSGAANDPLLRGPYGR